MNTLRTDKRKAVIAALVEGTSINSTVRMTSVSKVTILKLLRDLGCACAEFHDERVRGLKPARVQCDEIWAFVHCKEKHAKHAIAAPVGAGDVWTWTAIDPDNKLMITWHVGLRGEDDALAFMLDLSGRINNLTQLTTDGHAVYPPAVRAAFGDEVNYAQLIEICRSPQPSDTRYSPADCVGCRKEYVQGAVDSDAVSTSTVERSNLSIRMGMRRFTRLTNGHSKKIENHGHSLSVFFCWYNWCRPHMTLGGMTPAVVAGLADRTWSIEDLLALV